MKPIEVIDAYVGEVMRQVPSRERAGIGLELRGLLAEMLDDRAATEGRASDDAMVLALLREFGTPSEVAARYRPPGTIIIPAEQTRSFALMSTIGVVLQWALTLPRVFQGEALSSWWLSWGLGALWWPGLLSMIALLAAWLRATGLFKTTWRPRTVDPDRIHRGLMAFGLIWYVIGIVFMVALPWLVPMLPAPLPRILALDPAFLHDRAWLAPLLWIGHLTVTAVAFWQGRWSSRTRWLDRAFSVAWLAVLGWWLTAGDIFLAKPTDDGVRSGIALVMLIIVVDLAVKFYRRRTRFSLPAAMR